MSRAALEASGRGGGPAAVAARGGCGRRERSEGGLQRGYLAANVRGGCQPQCLLAAVVAAVAARVSGCLGNSSVGGRVWGCSPRENQDWVFGARDRRGVAEEAGLRGVPAAQVN